MNRNSLALGSGDTTSSRENVYPAVAFLVLVRVPGLLRPETESECLHPS